jgi:SAM-dependent methyltransferase
MTIPRLFDRAAYARRRLRARGLSFLAEDVGQNLAERLHVVTRTFQRALDLSSRAQIFAQIAPLAQHWTRTALAADGTVPLVADEEAVPFPAASFDLVVSALSLHAVNDLPGALLQIRHVLKPDGLFLGALFGGATLQELRAAFAAGESDLRGGISPRVAPLADMRDLGALLQRAGFAMPVADSDLFTVQYREFATLVSDLRALGETNVLAERVRAPLRRDVLQAVQAHYAAHHADAEGRLTATFEIVYLTAWAPHDSQPRPLAPGSARMRLAEALGTQELSAGEAAAPKLTPS